MGPFDLLFHLLGFIAPALAVGCATVFAARLLLGRASSVGPWWVQALVNIAVGVAVLAGGLWRYGVDGKMATYAALVVAVATVQWLCSKAWRRTAG
jgi:hypothetical protein